MACTRLRPRQDCAVRTATRCMRIASREEGLSTGWFIEYSVEDPTTVSVVKRAFICRNWKAVTTRLERVVAVAAEFLKAFPMLEGVLIESWEEGMGTGNPYTSTLPSRAYGRPHSVTNRVIACANRSCKNGGFDILPIATPHRTGNVVAARYHRNGRVSARSTLEREVRGHVV